MNDESEEIRLHVAGATVRHKSRFEHLISYANNQELSQDFIDKWVIPFYFDVFSVHNGDEFIQAMSRLKKRNKQRSSSSITWRFQLENKNSRSPFCGH